MPREIQGEGEEPLLNSEKNSRRGIEVVVVINPPGEVFYDYLESQEDSWVLLSETTLGGVFKTEITDLSGFCEDEGYIEPTISKVYKIGSTLYLSEEQKSAPARGYYSDKQARKLIKLLENQNLNCELAQRSGKNSLYIGGKTIDVRLDLGYKSFEIEEEVVRELMGDVQGRFLFLMDKALDYWRQMRAGLKNEEITLEAIRKDSKGDIVGVLDYLPLLTTPDELVRTVEEYACLYEKTINSLYELVENQPPSSEIMLTLW